nr:plasmid partitioning protein RepB [uncultured Gellertiella sp.]
MARKNILSGLLDPSPASGGGEPDNRPAPEQKSASGIKGLGALGAVTRSIDALAARADAAKLLEDRIAQGDVIIELQPEQLENSFITDRLSEDDEAFQALVEAIRARGQDTPILVRPHPFKPGLYQIAFGHRRARAARALGIPVRAVVKNLSDVDHVVAQGQENSARADLSFIERAIFASRLEGLGFSRDTITTALGSDKTTISKMLSVTNRIPGDILNSILGARTVGRDRWHELSTLFDTPGMDERARSLLRMPVQGHLTPAERFDWLMKKLKAPAPGKAAAKSVPVAEEWSRPGRAVRAQVTSNSRQVTIALKEAEGRAFGHYIASQLDRLFEAFEEEQSRDNGD